MRALMAAAAVVLVAGCSDPRDCSIGAVEADFAGIAVLDNCGELSSGLNGIDMAAYQAAQTCVVDHAQRHAPFFAGWTAQGVDTHQNGAYIGAMRGGRWTLAAFEQFGGVYHGDQPAERDSCTDLIAGSACSSWGTDLCVECVGRKTADQCMP